MKFYRTEKKIHASPDCKRIRSALLEIDETDLKISQLCDLCFTGHQKSLKVRCAKCGHVRTKPCRHNGGVLVVRGNTVEWRWPEDALGRTVVNPIQIG